MSEISIELDDKKEVIDQENNFSLLIAMERKGLAVKYGCLMGVCGVCELRVIEGMSNVEYFTEHIIDLTEDSILPCCCIAKGNIKLNSI